MTTTQSHPSAEEIVRLLREAPCSCRVCTPILDTAATWIERAAREIEALRGLLRDVGDVIADAHSHDRLPNEVLIERATLDAMRTEYERARAALSPEPEVKP